MTTTRELPSWTDYTADLGSDEYAEYMEQSAQALGGLRIMNLGNGRIALDGDAVATLQRQPEDADGGIEHSDGKLTMWIECSPFEVRPV